MTSPWAPVLIAVGAVLVAVFLVILFHGERKRDHGPGCGCDACWDAGVAKALRMQADDERKQRGGER